jgi:hypothetical protein
MRRPNRNTAFVVGFFVGFILFFLTMNYIDYSNRGICVDCGEKFGLPFRSLETGGQAFDSRIIWLGLIGNILIASAFGFLAGSILKFLWVKLISSKSALK